ncbi:MAG: site-specific integrase [Oscillospiraceae bacterium]|jgi:integrase|nr:site-specific integrase [Oscillospiraceae bacterium]
MAKRGQNIYRRKDGRWEGRFIASRTPEDKPKYSSVYAKTCAEVKQKLREKYVQLAQNQEAAPQPEPASFAAAAQNWLATAKMNCKESSCNKYAYLLERHILPCFEGMAATDLTRKILEDFVAKKLSSGRLDGCGGLVPKTVADIFSVIKQVLKYAGAPIFNIKIRNDAPKMKPFSSSEQKNLAAFLGHNSDFGKLGALLCLYTGIRVGELCALRWRNIDLHENILFVRGTMQRLQDRSETAENKTKIVVTAPKSNSSVRAIPLPAWLAAKLRAVRCENLDAYFLTGKVNSFLEPRNMQYKFQGYLKQSGVEARGFHALRHTFASNWVEKGLEIKCLSQILGHSSVKITLDRYVHTSMELKRSQMERMGDFLL